RSFDAIEDRRQVHRRQARLGDGHDALVTAARAETVEARGRDGDRAQARLPRKREQFAHAGILAVFGHVQLGDAPRIATDTPADRMEAVQDHRRGPRLPGFAALPPFGDMPALRAPPFLPRRSARRASLALAADSGFAGAALRPATRPGSASPRRGF